MTERDNERVVRDLVGAVINQRRYEVIPRCCHDDVVMHRPGGVEERNRDDYVAHYRRLHRAFPDLEATLEDAVVDTDRVAVRLRLTGTHEGTLMGIPPTGRRVEFTAQIVYRFLGDRIAEEWHESDRLGLLEQLDAVGL